MKDLRNIVGILGLVLILQAVACSAQVESPPVGATEAASTVILLDDEPIATVPMQPTSVPTPTSAPVPAPTATPGPSPTPTLTPTVTPLPTPTETPPPTATAEVIQAPEPTRADTPEPVHEADCNPSYPEVCIPSPPPDLDCGEIREMFGYEDIKVLQPDPHELDREKGGIGCES